MPDSFEYRPKFFDIRVKPPRTAKEEAEAKLKAGERICDNPACNAKATAKAPKSRDVPGDFYWFCQKHAAEYNKGWDFFAGMSEGEVRAKQAESRLGDRPTWAMKADRGSREASAFSATSARAAADPEGLSRAAQRKAESERERPLGKLERQALIDLDLDYSADPPTIRARYTELIKQCHPDANGGDRSAEQKMQRAIRAFKTLRSAKLA